VSVNQAASRPRDAGGVESAYAWMRLAAAVLIGTIGGVGMWSVVVILPTVQTAFGVDRGGASLPYTLTMIGVMAGGVGMGRLADRFGVMVPLLIGALCIGGGYMLSSLATDIWQFAVVQGLLIGVGCSASFGPLMADLSQWFDRRRGIAVAIAASGNYVAGTVWPATIQHFVETVGWRQAQFGIGAFCLLTLLPLALLFRRRPPVQDQVQATAAAGAGLARLGVSRNALQALLILAGISCCVAMSMPQVHIVAYCAGLGYGAARGAELLSVMLACGVLSRLLSGWIADRIGSTRTLLLGSTLQTLGLALYIPFDSLLSLYVISAVFGLSQGGIIPSYAMIVREFFPPNEAGFRLGLVLASTLGGMAVGGWLSGAIFDWTGSYQAAFANGVAWNLLNMAIAWWLLQRATRTPNKALGAAAAA